VGTGVIQFESGYTGARVLPEILGVNEWEGAIEFALRMGLFSEQTEFILESQIQEEFTVQPRPAGGLISPFYTLSPNYLNGINSPFMTGAIDIVNGFFSDNRLGIKYLVYDRYKDPERNKPNLYSWRANNVFQFRNLIPSVALYCGVNYTPTDAEKIFGAPQWSPRLMALTQSKLSAKTVLITNVIYDRIGTSIAEWQYLISISHNLYNPRWSWFVEGQKYKNDIASGLILRSGLAYLFHPNFQLDLQVGSGLIASARTTYLSGGLSYRLDFHKDPEMAQKSGNQSFGRLSKSERRAKKKAGKRNRKRGRG
jgi:hypothetical protein